MKKQSTLTLVLFAIYLLLLIWLILLKLQFSIPDIQVERVVNLVPLLGSFGGSSAILSGEIRANILVFIPLGIYICMLAAKWPLIKKVFAIVALTLAFEITQFIFAIGRADITDVLSNTLGGIIGIGIYALLFKVLKGKTNKVINILAMICTILVLSLIALLLINQRWVRIQ